MFVEFISKEAAFFPAATSAADAAAEKRAPARTVPFVKVSAARFAARVKAAAVSVTEVPFDAALMTAVVTPIGSAEYSDAIAVAVVLTDAASVASTLIVTVAEPSAFVEMVGMTVNVEGATSAAALFIAS